MGSCCWEAAGLSSGSFAEVTDSRFFLLQPFLYSAHQALNSAKLSFTFFTSSFDVNALTKAETSMKCWCHFSAACSDVSETSLSKAVFQLLGSENHKKARLGISPTIKHFEKDSILLFPKLSNTLRRTLFCCFPNYQKV